MNCPMRKDKVDGELDNKAGTLYGETQLIEDPCAYEPTQLYGGTQALDDPVGPGFTEVLEDPVDTAMETQLVEDMGDWIETQLVEDMGDWIETQLVEHEEGEEGKTGCENGPCEAGNCREREEKQRPGGKCEEKECLVDSDASTDDEGCRSGIIQRRLTSLRVASVRSSARAASRNFASKSDTGAVNGTSKSPNFLIKCTTLYNTAVREKVDSKTDSGPNQAKDKTARQLFADVALETERVCSVSADPLPKESVPLLSYMESQEPGILSQENALEVVDKLIASHEMSPTAEGRNVEDFNNRETAARLPRTSAQNGTIQLAKNMGPASLAKKARIFDWDDVKEDETGGDFFTKKKDLFYGRKKPQSQPPKGKERENARGLDHSDSRLILQPRDKVSYENIRKNLFNETENEGAVHVMDNVGPDTQIAVEAIHALVHGSPVRPGSSKGMEIVGEIERERISNDGRNKSIASTKVVEKTKEKVRTRGRKKLMPDEDKLVNSAKKRKVPTKNQSVTPEKVTSDTKKTGLDIFSDWASIPRRARSSPLGKTATPPKNSGQNASCGKKRVFIRSATELLDKAKRRRKVFLSDKEKASMPSMEIGKGSPVFTPKKSQKKALDGGSYRPSVQKEMLRLEMGESSVVRKWKDLRVRRDFADARVLLSHHLDEKVIRQQRKILERLGIPEASSMLDGTHFVAVQFVRTRNLLEAMARGKPIVTPSWLERCNLSSQFVDEKNFILRDAKKEKEIRFSMPNSLATACHSPLLKGKRVLITPSVKPSLGVVRNLVIACGGTPMERIVSSLIKRKVHDDLLLVSCEEDYQTCRPLLEKGVNAYCSELILNGIVIQKLEFERICALANL
ncbi:PAX-interacting protein 1 [Carex littledalei]|uniref:PAX-interacting protein 1 n=1 Tax=Carex littledalei TaxID=544730 RepID=A0A833QS25_9POAL|nr:PAX-interacting protein 1 [Carex littledalei]